MIFLPEHLPAAAELRAAGFDVADYPSYKCTFGGGSAEPDQTSLSVSALALHKRSANTLTGFNKRRGTFSGNVPRCHLLLLLDGFSIHRTASIQTRRG